MSDPEISTEPMATEPVSAHPGGIPKPVARMVESSTPETEPAAADETVPVDSATLAYPAVGRGGEAPAEPVSGGPGAPGYKPGYAQVGAREPAYRPVDYPTASYPAGVPDAPEPGRRRSVSTALLAILLVVFVVIAGVTTAMYLGRNSDVSSQANLVKQQRDQIQSLQQQVQTNEAAAASAKQTSDGQISDLQKANGALKQCVNDANSVIDLNDVFITTFNSDWNKMVTSCVAAKNAAK